MCHVEQGECRKSCVHIPAQAVVAHEGAVSAYQFEQASVCSGSNRAGRRRALFGRTTENESSFQSRIPSVIR